MTRTSPRQAARQAMASYHEEQLGLLLAHVSRALDRFHDGQLDAFEVDRVLLQYSRAAKELWKFCNLHDAEFAAGLVGEQPPLDWWHEGAPKQH